MVYFNLAIIAAVRAKFWGRKIGWGGERNSTFVKNIHPCKIDFTHLENVFLYFVVPFKGKPGLLYGPWAKLFILLFIKACESDNYFSLFLMY